MANNSINSTTQTYLDIYDITNDLVVMKDGSASIILTVNALNFGLLAEEEQDAIISLALVNMIFRGDGKNNMGEGDCFQKRI